MLYEKVLKFINDNALIQSGTVVIAAVSGGADSVCLFDILINLRDRLGITVECAHLNHNLRGSESDGDEAYVRSLCKKNGIILHSKSVEVAKLANGRSLEDVAREVRYGFFDEIIKGKNAVIATAHNANDNTETFFINLIRGSGSRGLCGIPIRRAGIVRPLLCAKREEILEHLDGAGLSYRVDSSNSDTEYLRNFIRHKVIPLLSSRSDTDIHKSILKTIANLQSENRALYSIAKRCESDEISKLCELEDAVLYRVLTSNLEAEYGIILDNTHFILIKDLLRGKCTRVQIRDNIFAVNEYGKFRFERSNEKCLDIKELRLGENIFCGKKIFTENVKEIYKALTKKYIDCDKIIGSLYVRTRRDGDIFICQNRKCSKHLKKLLINDKIEKPRRDALCVICDGNGNIVFAEGYGADARFAADENSKNIMSIEII